MSRNIDPDYVMAPYRFVDIDKRVVLPPAEVAGRLQKDGDGLFAKPLENGLSGRLTLEWEAETPLLIGQKTRADNGSDVDAPLKIGEDYWIPGASLRGMIRSAADICGFARLSQVNHHHVYPLRDFNHPIYSDPDGTFGGYAVARPDMIRAGWLFLIKDDHRPPRYAIQPCKLRYIDEPLLAASGCIDASKFTVSWLRVDLLTKYDSVGMIPTSGDRKPDFTAKTFQFRDTGKDKWGREKVAFHHGGGSSVSGTLVFADAVPKGQEIARPGHKQQPKNVEYVFLGAPDKEKAKPIPPQAFERFHLVHTAPGRNERDPVGTWSLLKPVVDAGKPIPVFYVGDLSNTADPRFAFGLTRMFKVPHKYGVRDKLRKLTSHIVTRKEGGWYEPNMVEALFGHVHEPRDLGVPETDTSPGDALKSRLAFSGARITPANTATSGPYPTVMSTARASFAPFYLKGDIKDWSDEAAELAGRKRYLPRSPEGATATANALAAIRARLERQTEASNANEKTRSNLTLLHGLRNSKPAPLRFSSQIDLHNITPEELGLLLFVLTHGGDGQKRYRHMLGRAKPFGAGQLRLVSIGLRIDWAAKAVEDHCHKPPTEAERPGPQREGWLTSKTTWSIAPFLEAFCKHALPQPSNQGPWLPAFLALGQIKEFLAVSDPANGARLNGPHRPPRTTNKTPQPDQDNYLRLQYKVSGADPEELPKNQNPYQELRKATMPQKDKSRPANHPARLLPGLK